MPLNLDPELIDALRSDLTNAGYTSDGVAALLGPVAADALDREQVVPARRATARYLASSCAEGQSPEAAGSMRALASVVRLLMLGCAVPVTDVDAALPNLRSEGAASLGLIQVDDSVAHALVELIPYTATDVLGEINWWFASDLSELASGAAVRNDYVLGVGGASQMLAQITIREPVSRVLDLGTGCGIQALHATRHLSSPSNVHADVKNPAAGASFRHEDARSAGVAVVATDISERALEFARFNAVLNLGPDHPIEFRLGSMLEPVAGETFDLIVSNPPFVITPHEGAAGAAVHDAIGDFEYRDGGRSGDDLVRDLMLDIGDYLAPGGIAQFLANWEHRRGQTWQDRLSAWLDAATSRSMAAVGKRHSADLEEVSQNLDAWIIQRETLDPAHYGETWLRDGGTTEDRDPDAFAKAYNAYLDDFETRDVEAIGFGIVILRRPVIEPVEITGTGNSEVVSTDSTTWRMRRLEEHGGALRQPLGQHLAASLHAETWLASMDDETLLAQHLTRAADVTEERFYTPGLSDPNVIVIRQGDGFLRGVHSSSPLAAFVGACDGDLSIGDLLTGMSHIYEVDLAALTAELLPAIRGLVRDGFLLTP